MDVRDFQPISLLRSVYKIIAKVLAGRLGKVVEISCPLLNLLLSREENCEFRFFLLMNVWTPRIGVEIRV